MQRVELISVRATSSENDVMQIKFTDGEQSFSIDRDCSEKSPYEHVTGYIKAHRLYGTLNPSSYNNSSLFQDEIFDKLEELEKDEDKRPLQDYIKTLILS